MSNKYNLLNIDSHINAECEREIDRLICEFRVKYLSLEDKYNCGIGDTATDEAVAEEFYEVIHYKSEKDRPSWCK